ncbi:MAG: Cysteine desulfurase [Candidatus Ozemobacter sibiricus]|uniref:Cysteine desulfurase n=1 Tax=Candidatus Ozemobacter sibiricus TaxID=2268124 RepID=A0A367ZUW5_9BACT|nr:MAG: Cysteine desulfurase [Candidatus Ozemobacter sibiricus]
MSGWFDWREWLQQLNYQPLLYFDHNATTPVAPAVRRAMADALAGAFGNASSLHTLGRTSRGLVETARRAVAAELRAPPERVFFTSGGTEGNNTVIKGVFAARGGGHVITTKIEHESVLGACHQLEALGGRVTYLPAGPDGRVRSDDVRAALRSDTILVSVMHANNETGVIQPLEEIAAVTRAAGVPLHTDAVQTFGKIPTDVERLGVEFLTLTAHKINGPKGVGAIYWRGTVPCVPLIYGGDQEQKQRAGTEGVHQLVGLGVAARLAGACRPTEFVRLRALRRRLVAGIRRLYPAAVINEAAPDHQLPGTINVTFPGKSGLRLLAGLDCYEIAVSIGSACTADRIEPSHVLLGMGISEERALSTIRISLGRTTRRLSVLFFLWALERVLRSDPPGFAYLDPAHLTADVIRSPHTFLIDLRFPHERLLAPSLPGAREWSPFGFERHHEEIPRDRRVILMCATGALSTGAGYRLAMAGHPDVRVVFGGYSAWRGLYPDLLDHLLKERSSA